MQLFVYTFKLLLNVNKLVARTFVSDKSFWKMGKKGKNKGAATINPAESAPTIEPEKPVEDKKVVEVKAPEPVPVKAPETVKAPELAPAKVEEKLDDADDNAGTSKSKKKRNKKKKSKKWCCRKIKN